MSCDPPVCLFPPPPLPPPSLQAGREGRKKYGFKKRKLNPSSSTTNREKRKRKTFMMVRKKKSVRAKGMKSFQEKQVSTSDCYIVNLIIMGHLWDSSHWLLHRGYLTG